MNKFARKIIIGIICGTISLSSFSIGFAGPLLLHEDKVSKNLSSGVVHEHIKQFHASGWWNINVLRINLDDEHTKVGTLFSSGGVSQRDTVTDMMKGTEAIGAINSDFFPMTGTSYPLGAVINNGEIVSSPANKNLDPLPTFAIDDSNNPFMLYWDWSVNVVAENGKSAPATAVNKNSYAQGNLFVYNDKWGSVSHTGKSSETAEMIVKEGIVTEIRIGQAPISIPKGATVVSARGKLKSFLLDNFYVGSKADFLVNGSPNFDTIKTAVGGGSMLLKDGEKTDFYINIQGNQPRTALGITKDKKQLIMMTIDGRDKTFNGVTQDVLVEIMKHLGAYDAINFDGGGSTTMAVKNREDEFAKVTNIPSGGTQRKVTNALGVFDSAPMGKLKYLEIATEDTNVFANTSRYFTVKGYDEFYHPLDVNINDVTFSVEGVEGQFEGNKLLSKSTGFGKVKAELNGALGELSINVMDNIKALKTDLDKIAVNVSETQSLSNIYGINKKGIKSKINIDDIEWEVVGGVGRVQNGIFYASDNASSGALIGRFGDTIKTILVSVGLESTPLNDFESVDGIGTSSFPKEHVGGSIELSNDGKVGNSSIKMNYDFSRTDKTRAFYAILGKGITLGGEPKGLGLWINGNNDESWVRGDLVDSNGKYFKVDFANSVNWNGWKWVNAKVPSDVKYPVTIDKIYVAQTNPNNRIAGNLLIDGLSGLYSKDSTTNNPDIPNSTEFVDEYNKSTEVSEGGFKFLASYASNTPQFMNILKENKYAYTLGNLKIDEASGINTNIIPLDKGFDFKKDNNTVLMRLNNLNGGIRASNPEQWLWLKDILAGSSEENIVLLLPKSIYEFEDKLEENLFNSIIKEYNSKGKNIYVVYSGKKTSVELKDGVRYFEINPSGNYIQFVVNNSEINYQIIPIQK